MKDIKDIMSEDNSKINSISNSTEDNDITLPIDIIPQTELLSNERSIIKPIVWVEKNPDWKYTEFCDDPTINDLLNELMSYDLSPQPVAPLTIKIIYGNRNKGTYDCCPLEKDTNKPTLQVKGKSPSVVTAFGAKNLSHKKHHNRLPTLNELRDWFEESFHGVGSLGSRKIVWLDFDAKDFESQDACENWVFEFIAKNGFEEVWLEKTGSGGFRIPIGVEEYPSYATMAAKKINSKIIDIPVNLPPVVAIVEPRKIPRLPLALPNGIPPIDIGLFFTEEQNNYWYNCPQEDDFKLAAIIQGVLQTCQDLNLPTTTIDDDDIYFLVDSLAWAKAKNIESKFGDSYFLEIARNFYAEIDPDSDAVKILDTRIAIVKAKELEAYKGKVKEAQKPLIGWQPRGTVHQIDTKFVADFVLPRMPKNSNVGIQAATGAGKSTFIRKFVETKSKEKFLSIVPTISTGRLQVEQYGYEFIYWEDVKGQPLKSVQKLIITYDSLHKLAGADFSQYNIILDEIDSGVSHLLQSSTVEKNNGRHNALKTFKEILGKCKSVTSLEANHTNPVADFISDLAPHLPIVNFTSTVKRKTANYYAYIGDENRAAFDDVLEEKLKQEKKLAITSDNQTELKTIHKLIAETYPTLNVFRFDSETSKTTRGLEFANNPTAYCAKYNLDIILFSPSLNQGASLEVSAKLMRGNISLEQNNIDWESLNSYFDCEFDIAVHLNPYKTRQRYNRIRQPIDRYVFIGKDIELKGCTSPFWEQQLRNVTDHHESLIELYEFVRQESHDDATRAYVLRQMADIVERIAAGEFPEQNCLAKLRARECDQQTNRAAKIIEQLKDEGKNVIVVDSSETPSDGVFTEELKFIKDETREKFASDVVNISTENVSLDDLTNKEKLNYRQKTQVAKLIFEAEYPGLLSLVPMPESFYLEQVVKKNRQWLTAQKMWFKYNNPEFDITRDIDSLLEVVIKKDVYTGSNTNQDHKHISPMLTTVRAWGLFDIFDPTNPSQEFNIKDKNVVAFLKKSDAKTKKLLKQYFNTTPEALFKGGIKSINKILSRFGWTLKQSSRTKSDKFYVMTLVVTAERTRKSEEKIAGLIQGVLKTKNAASLASGETQKTVWVTQQLSSSIYNKAVASPHGLASQVLASEVLTEVELNKIFGLLPGFSFSFSDSDEKSEEVFQEALSMVIELLNSQQDAFSPNRMLRELALGVIQWVDRIESEDALQHLASEIETLITRGTLTETTAGLFLEAYNCYSTDLATYLSEKDYKALQVAAEFYDIERHEGALFRSPAKPTAFVAAKDVAKEIPTVRVVEPEFEQLSLLTV